ncbi:MAG: hypothetical protein QME81_04910 [bacterium]|nr:hypothetical protein [bacterium]
MQSQLEWLDIYVELIKGSPAELKISSVDSSGRKEQVSTPFSLNPQEISFQLRTFEQGHELKKRSEYMRSLGGKLFAQVFTGKVKEHFLELTQTRTPGVSQTPGVSDALTLPLRIRLRLKEPALANLPWEAMHQDGNFLAASASTTLVLSSSPICSPKKAPAAYLW